MATLTRNHTISIPSLNLTGFFTGIVGFFDSVAAAHQAAREFERLNGRSDAALEREGLTREDARSQILQTYL